MKLGARYDKELPAEVRERGHDGKCVDQGHEIRPRIATGTLTLVREQVSAFDYSLVVGRSEANYPPTSLTTG